jgi:hypothetical protein
MINNLLARLDDLKKKVGIQLAIKDSGLDKKRFDEMLEPISVDYFNQVNRSPINSRMSVEERRKAGVPASLDDVRGLFLHAWNGTRAEIK